ncbi:MAG: hypothetical protein JNK15_23205 [Planctomycetes bacterium]|nr:hypothetical protein [Planctomycetota bacterium]
MSARALLFLAATLSGLAATAQGDQERAQADLARMQRQLQSSRSEGERLLDLRMRHDLGLPTDSADRTFRQATPTSSEAMERMHQELRDQEAENLTLVERFEKLRSAVDQLRADAAAKQAGTADPDAVTEIPSAGGAPKSGLPRGERPFPTPESETVVPDAASKAQKAMPDAVLDPVAMHASIDPVRAQIHGSTDHQRVAHALFKAGQALMDRAVAVRDRAAVTKDPALLASAKELDERGKDRLRRALDELAPLLKEKEPAFEALFCKGRCLELLFRHSERHEGLSLTGTPREWQQREQQVRDPFLMIAARDVTKAGSRGEAEVLGPWGKAAQSAIEHFRWMNVNASYDALAAIRAITWPGEKDQ